MKTRMLRLAVIPVSHYLLLTLYFCSLGGRRRPQPTGDDLTPGEPDELTVGSQIALHELARLHEKPPEPFQSQPLHPARRPPDVAGQYVKAAAHTHDDRDIQALAVALAPDLLEGRRHADEKHVGATRPDLLDDPLMIIRAEIAVAEARDHETRILSPAMLSQR